MKPAALAGALLAALALSAAGDEAPARPLTPAEAAKKVDEKVTVEFEVRSTGGKDNAFLNSEADYKSDKNFTLFLPKEALAKFKEAKVADPREHFKGKTVRATGKVTLFKDKPQIKIEEPGQIKLVEAKK